MCRDGAVAAVLTGVVCWRSSSSASRAMRVDPLVALRSAETW